MSGAWFLHPRPNPHASLRLFCLPYAGGGASIFRSWPESLPLGVEVVPIELPGRETRLRERPFSRLSALVDELVEVLPPHLDRPFALFGHSMGALIGFELARALRDRGRREPTCLFVSAAGAPHTANPHPLLHAMPDDELHRHLRRLNGTPPAVLEHQELMKIFLPLLRADLEVCETYAYRPATPLAAPIFAFGGARDRLVSRERLEAWREETRSGFSHWTLPGDHFFLNSSRRLLLWIVAGELERITTRLGARRTA
jgi:medium-chain acyl-[acyl-carrier-protein] hydrolase